MAIGFADGIQVLERGWLSANAVVLTPPPGREGRGAVVDTGYCTHAAQTVALVEHALDGRALDLIVNTHLHSDHCGGNAALRARWPRSLTLIPPGHAREVRRWDEDALTYKATGQECPRFDFDATLEPGDEVELGGRDWQGLAAPGHDTHSVVLFEPRHGVLLSADALWENGFGVVFPELEGGAAAWDEVALTLDAIERLAPRVVVPGHGRPFDGVEQALARARSRLASFRASPSRHATHAAKVLLKYKLLEWQERELDAFVAWAEGLPYLTDLWRRYFAGQPMRDWLLGNAQALAASGAAALESRDGRPFIVNRG